MDTESLWQAIAAYGNARWRGISHDHDAADHLAEIQHLLNEADADRQELLATNERLVDENAELRQENQRLAQAVRWESDLCQQALESRKELEAENAELKAAYESQFKELHELKAKLTKKAELLRGCYAAGHQQKKRIEELTAERILTYIHGVALAEDHRDLPGIAKDAKEALEKKHEAAT